MKVSYSLASGRASPHCITWVYRKKRHRKYFRSRIDAVRFRNEKEQELGIRGSTEIENEIIFLALNENLSGLLVIRSSNLAPTAKIKSQLCIAILAS